MVAVGFVIVHTHASGQRQRLKNTPFVFNKQRVLAGRGIAAGAAGQVHRIFQFVVSPFAAEGQQLVNFTKRQDILPVDTVAFGGNRAAVTRVFVIDFLAVEF
ncbi:hypothetical protein D3C72_2229750 [compost metagenome]